MNTASNDDGSCFITTSNNSKQLSICPVGSESFSRFACHLATKSGKLCRYEIKISAGGVSGAVLQIISSSKQKVKSTLDIATIHAKETPKQPRQPGS